MAKIDKHLKGSLHRKHKGSLHRKHKSTGSDIMSNLDIGQCLEEIFLQQLMLYK